eukprot:TRINITY_DN11139_c0_g1_i1.p1 TRINITY_DN11139_c0_g1~~TRINITY_DN11139_c0_g1_i1.p1  ORF type:complete len:141 (+),score=17.10 TRINITY_DN11139_c0_g1_i1:632-1054(+)
MSRANDWIAAVPLFKLKFARRLYASAHAKKQVLAQPQVRCLFDGSKAPTTRVSTLQNSATPPAELQSTCALCSTSCWGLVGLILPDAGCTQTLFSQECQQRITGSSLVWLSACVEQGSSKWQQRRATAIAPAAKRKYSHL